MFCGLLSALPTRRARFLDNKQRQSSASDDNVVDITIALPVAVAAHVPDVRLHLRRTMSTINESCLSV